MELNIEGRTAGNSLVLELDGNLVMGDSNAKLRKSVRDSIEAGYKDIVLEMSDVDYVDSSGVGELISSLTAVNRADGSFVLLTPTDKAHKLLAISQLTDIFDIRYQH